MRNRGDAAAIVSGIPETELKAPEAWLRAVHEKFDQDCLRYHSPNPSSEWATPQTFAKEFSYVWGILASAKCKLELLYGRDMEDAPAVIVPYKDGTRFTDECTNIVAAVSKVTVRLRVRGFFVYSPTGWIQVARHGQQRTRKYEQGDGRTAGAALRRVVRYFLQNAGTHRAHHSEVMSGNLSAVTPYGYTKDVADYIKARIVRGDDVWNGAVAQSTGDLLEKLYSLGGDNEAFCNVFDTMYAGIASALAGLRQRLASPTQRSLEQPRKRQQLAGTAARQLPGKRAKV